MGSGRKAPVWARAFLRGLRRTGNVKEAARVAGIDPTTAYARRQRDPRFAARWAQEAATGKAAAAAAGAAARPPGRAAAGPKTELILRRGRRGDQLVKAGAGRWNARAETVFLATLAQTACVLRAAEACGFSAESCHYRRRRYPELAAKWEAAMGEADLRLPEMLTAAGIAGLDPGAAALDVPKADIDQSIAICRMRGLGMVERSGGRVPPRREPSIEEVRDEVLRRIAAIRRHRERNAGGDRDETS